MIDIEKLKAAALAATPIAGENGYMCIKPAELLALIAVARAAKAVIPAIFEMEVAMDHEFGADRSIEDLIEQKGLHPKTLALKSALEGLTK